MKIGVYGRQFNNTVIPYVQQVFDCLVEKNVEVLVYQDFYDFLKDKLFLPKKFSSFKTHIDLKEQVDVMISLGGDGTMLDTVTLVRDSGIPMIGINFGRLGFLASINKEGIKSAIDGLIQKKFTLDTRRLLEVNSSTGLFGDTNFALNDFTILKRDTSAMILIHCFLNGEFLNSYWADGLIVSTPTGSTGYSLSCGGPLITPGAKNFVLTPVSPHNLNVRPIIVSDESVISFEIEGRTDKFLISLDSRSTAISSDLKLSVKKEKFSAKLVKLPNDHFFDTLRQKLNWGFDMRN